MDAGEHFVQTASSSENLPPLGAMIETPAAALTVGQIARHADFLSVGTNDLTQYTLVAGRDNATVSDYYEDTHPSILRLLGIIIAEASGKPVTICGEMADREEVIPTLLQIGFRPLGVSPPLIPRIKQLIRSMDSKGRAANAD
jgi:phosphoenolpyruvate-protein kinase (PTS system EI component)